MVRVAVGVLRDHLGRVLIALRPSHKHQGDLWEFPGGKIEAGESPEAALNRELFEELGVAVRDSAPLITVPFSYSDKKVLLEVRDVLAFDGVPCGKEGQLIRWVSLGELGAYRFPEANEPIVKAVRLPESICITGFYANSDDFYVRIRRAIGRGAGMILFRPDETAASVELVGAAIDICNDAGVSLVVSSQVDREFWQRADGLHLRAEHLRAFTRRPVGASQWLGASCHNLKEAEEAKALGVDYIFLSPVLPTDSHPGVATLGWSKFAALVARFGIPAYALGGMRSQDTSKAKLMGARGIAGISAFWE